MVAFLAGTSWRLAGQFEAAGFDMWQVSWMDVKFWSLVPTNPRVSCEKFHGPDDAVELNSELCDGCALVWDDLRVVDRGHSPENSRCLWDFILIDNAEDDAVLEFVQKWGCIDSGHLTERPTGNEEDPWEDLKGPDALCLPSIRRVSHAARLFLDVLIATEAEKLVPLDMLELIDEEVGTSLAEVLTARGVRSEAEKAELREALLWSCWEGRTVEDYFAASRVIWRRWREAERRDGRGLEYQQQLLVDFVFEWANVGQWDPVWENGVRSVTSTALGARELAFVSLREIFAAPVLDVFACSVCGMAFPADGSGRRPRRNAARFCGPDCRTAARLESNRKSWHRNKPKWRPPSATRQGTT